MSLGRHWMWRKPRRMRSMRCSGLLKATLDSQPRRSSDQIPSTGLRSGVGRQVVDGTDLDLDEAYAYGWSEFHRMVSQSREAANSRKPAALWTFRCPR
jgi:hypothetical protein